METDLGEPLLSKNENINMSLPESSNWPKEVAERTKFYIPNDYDPYQTDGEPGKCFLDYDVERKILKYVSVQNGDTLDIIDPEDIIGASVEVELFGPPDELRATTMATTNDKTWFQNKKDTTMPSTPVGCGIFQTLNDDNDHLFSVSRNEPSSEIPYDTQAAAVLTIYVYPRTDHSNDSVFGACGLGGGSNNNRNKYSEKEYVKQTDPSKLGSRCARHRRFQIAPAEDFSDISIVVRAIRTLSCQPKIGRLLVIVNPFSGKQTGKEVYEKHLCPMLEQGGFEHDYLVTEYAKHAEVRMKEQPEDSDIKDVAEYGGIIAVGGDGILHEILQGIRQRSDNEKILTKLRFGHIGAGTSNGFSKSLTYACKEKDTATDYCFQVAKGRTIKMDISKYQTAGSEFFSFLTFSWGIIADIDIESEAIRFLGSLRMDVWAVWRVLSLRTYRARFSYVPPGKNVELPPIGEPLDKEWVTEETDFILFWASHVTHAAERTFHSPPSKPAEGVFTIFIVRNNVSRLRLALILLALETGDHMNMHGVEFIKCTAYRLEPISPGSFNDLDGEVIESGTIQGKVLPGAMQVFCNL